MLGGGYAYLLVAIKATRYRWEPGQDLLCVDGEIERLRMVPGFVESRVCHLHQGWLAFVSSPTARHTSILPTALAVYVLRWSSCVLVT